MSNRRKPGIFKKQKKTKINNVGLTRVADTVSQEKVLVKTVPAKIDEEVVGTTYIFEDGTVEVVFDKNISAEAQNKLDAAMRENPKAAAYQVGE